MYLVTLVPIPVIQLGHDESDNGWDKPHQGELQQLNKVKMLLRQRSIFHQHQPSSGNGQPAGAQRQPCQREAVSPPSECDEDGTNENAAKAQAEQAGNDNQPTEALQRLCMRGGLCPERINLPGSVLFWTL